MTTTISIPNTTSNNTKATRQKSTSRRLRNSVPVRYIEGHLEVFYNILGMLLILDTGFSLQMLKNSQKLHFHPFFIPTGIAFLFSNQNSSTKSQSLWKLDGLKENSSIPINFLFC